MSHLSATNRDLVPVSTHRGRQRIWIYELPPEGGSYL